MIWLCWLLFDRLKRRFRHFFGFWVWGALAFVSGRWREGPVTHRLAIVWPVAARCGVPFLFDCLVVFDGTYRIVIVSFRGAKIRPVGLGAVSPGIFRRPLSESSWHIVHHPAQLLQPNNLLRCVWHFVCVCVCGRAVQCVGRRRSIFIYFNCFEEAVPTYDEFILRDCARRASGLHYPDPAGIRDPSSSSVLSVSFFRRRSEQESRVGVGHQSFVQSVLPPVVSSHRAHMHTLSPHARTGTETKINPTDCSGGAQRAVGR